MVFEVKYVCPFADSTGIEQLEKRARREYTIVTYATTLPHVLKQRLSVDILINDNGRFPILSVRPLNTISIRIACKS